MNEHTIRKIAQVAHTIDIRVMAQRDISSGGATLPEWDALDEELMEKRVDYVRSIIDGIAEGNKILPRNISQIIYISCVEVLAESTDIL